MRVIRNDTDYALRMLVHLAEQSPRGVAASDLSDQLDVPHGFAQKILRKLVAAGILEAKPGRRGGFGLVRPPRGVSLMDVIVAVQGPLLLSRCVGLKTACARQPSCRINATLKGFQNKLDAFLCRTSLSDILRGPVGGELRITQAGFATGHAGIAVHDTGALRPISASSSSQPRSCHRKDPRIRKE